MFRVSPVRTPCEGEEVKAGVGVKTPTMCSVWTQGKEWTRRAARKPPLLTPE